MTVNVNLPGRLGNPDQTLGDDPRTDPRLAAALVAFGAEAELGMMGAMAAIYDPDGDPTNPLAWPYHASTSDLQGLPPHVISVNQLDPLRDESLAYFRKLLDAGVSVVSRTVNGTSHAGDVIFRTELPEVYGASARDLVGFARSL